MNVGGGEGRAVGGWSAVSYGAAGAVNNSQAKEAVVADETKQGSNARPPRRLCVSAIQLVEKRLAFTSPK